MRVLFLPFSAAKSHVYHLTPVAWAMRTAGHQVRVASSPDLADDIANAGLTGVSIGQPMFEALTEVDEDYEPAKEERTRYAPGELPVQTDYARDDPHGELAYLTGSIIRGIVPDPMLDELVGFARSWQPDLVIWDQMCPAGAVAARASGAAHARLLWGADALVQLRAASLGQGDPLRDWLEPTLRRYGCDFDEEVLTGQWTLDTTPSWAWHPPRSAGVCYVPVRHLAFNGPSQVPPWLYGPASRRRICVSLGVTLGESNLAEASAADLLDAVADLDAEVVAALSADQLKSATVPDNVRVVDFVPVNALLPTCSAIVHHGGAGTFSAALEHGVPQLIVPGAYWSSMFYGPVAFANGLAEQGAGVYVAADSDHLTPDALRDSLLRVLDDPSYAANAARLRAEALGTPAPNDVVPALERLAAQHRPPAGARGRIDGSENAFPTGS